MYTINLSRPSNSLNSASDKINNTYVRKWNQESSKINSHFLLLIAVFFKVTFYVGKPLKEKSM